MPEINILRANIIGFQNISIPNKIFRHTRPSPILAVMFPGLNYSCDMPLFYYLTQLLLSRQVDVLQLRADYTGAAYQSLPDDQQLDWIAADAQAAVEAVHPTLGYTKLVFIGKSFGTLALASLASSNEGCRDAAMIWLTPLLHNPWLVEGACQAHGPALFVGSQADRSFDEIVMAYIQKKTGCESFIVTGADHRLEYQGDILHSLRVLGEIINRIQGFLDLHSIQGD